MAKKSEKPKKKAARHQVKATAMVAAVAARRWRRRWWRRWRVAGDAADASLEAEARRRYLNYALCVITSRALPDVRDGLKPVQRRILYAMLNDDHLRPDAKYRKSAKVVGTVIGRYHPHGDTAVYDAMVRMAQDWALRVPLVDGSGNFGSLDGDEAAAYRYTECRLAPPAMELLRELDFDTVDMRANYDGTTEEPTVLPARFPNLLVNGSTGIAVGMATNIPPHNLKRDRRRADRAVEGSQDRARHVDEAHQRPGLPDRRPAAQQQGRAAPDLQGRRGHDPRARRVQARGEEARRHRHRHHVDPVRDDARPTWSRRSPT